MSEPACPNAALDDALGGLIRTIGEGLTSLGEQDLKILSLCDLMGDRIIAQQAESGELREGLAALSHRLEGLARAVATLDDVLAGESVRVLRQP